MIDDVSESKPDLMPERASEHPVNQHKSPFRVGIARSRVIGASDVYFVWFSVLDVLDKC